MKHDVLVEWFRENRTRLTTGAAQIANRFDISIEEVKKAKKAARVKVNVLVIGDLHEPFSRDEYLEHCKEVYKKYKCNKVIFIGDIIDSHFSSYHETDPDGLSAGDELDEAIARIGKWYEAFPLADVILGNHDLIVQRKVFSSGVSKRWIKQFKDVLHVPSWNFTNQIIYDNVLYVHGTGTSGMSAAYGRMMNRGISTVCGHIHTEGSIRYNATNEALRFAMMVGCGVDEAAYAMEYGKNFSKKMILSCGVVLDNGQLPVILPLKLKK
jgi:hypothetical protein